MLGLEIRGQAKRLQDLQVEMGIANAEHKEALAQAGEEKGLVAVTSVCNLAYMRRRGAAGGAAGSAQHGVGKWTYDKDA